VALANDKKRQQTFDAKNDKLIKGMGKRNAADRIMTFLNPKTTAGVKIATGECSHSERKSDDGGEQQNG
jgi:hypothetical protein